MTPSDLHPSSSKRGKNLTIRLQIEFGFFRNSPYVFVAQVCVLVDQFSSWLQKRKRSIQTLIGRPCFRGILRKTRQTKSAYAGWSGRSRTDYSKTPIPQSQKCAYRPTHEITSIRFKERVTRKQEEGKVSGKRDPLCCLHSSKCVVMQSLFVADSRRLLSTIREENAPRIRQKVAKYELSRNESSPLPFPMFLFAPPSQDRNKKVQ